MSMEQNEIDRLGAIMAANGKPIMTPPDAEEAIPVALVEELRIEGDLVPHRRGELYRLAAGQIMELERRLAEATAERDKESRRADAWVKAARDLSRELGMADDESDGSIKDWSHIRSILSMRKERAEKAEASLSGIEKVMREAGMTVPGWIEHGGKRDQMTLPATLLMFELDARQEALASAASRERERIAKIVDEWGDAREAKYGGDALHNCASAIRELDKK